ncbi:aldehyde dehydrogenase family protein [Sphingosinicella xenopeptidilytica]|uniref:Aldehyde dehydrogenase family protein n=1 Tax=Sphingosinicella xenopeptidilytica TaxID=364098 RepID=A0ABW3C9I9_SPHXN
MDFDAAYTMTINGAAVAGEARFPVLNPATEAVLGAAPDCTRAELDTAVAAARAAFPGWAATPVAERRAAILALSAAIAAHQDALSRLLTREQGKPQAEAMAEVQGAAWFLAGFTDIDLPVDVVEDAGRRFETHHVPIGVVGAISPWNFPVMLAMFKIGPALIAGNTMVLKPSPFAPLAALKIGEIARDILPPGVLNVVSGGDDLGPWLTAHPGIDKLSFTGSSATGRRVMESAAHSLKRVTLELGGNDAAIVLPDVDVQVVAEKLFWSAFANNGQICVATKRMYIHKDIYEPLKAAIVEYAKGVKVGDGSEQGTGIGPINNKQQYDRVIALIEDAKANGYDFLMGGDTARTEGYFIPITILDNPPETSRIVREEQFGPVLPLLRFDDIDEAVARANESEYGLAGSVWSGNEAAAVAVANRLGTGTVWINDLQALSPRAAFGGHRQSGLGIEGSVHGLLEYTLPRTVVTTLA